MDWIPTLSEWSGPIYLRLVEALTSDIASGRLARGRQLPTHRALAQALGIDLTTVTRAYGEARRRGLIEARVGHGTFVSETTARSAAHIPFPVKIDLSMNVPPQPVEANLDQRIGKGFASLQSKASFSAFLNYQRAGGSDEEREIAANWLRARLPEASPERVVIYPGNQAILFNALMFGIASFTAQFLLRRLYRPLIERNPKHRVLLRAWLIVFAFVGIQMGWVLRPLIGAPGTPFSWFRPVHSNFFEAIAQQILNLFK